MQHDATAIMTLPATAASTTSPVTHIEVFFDAPAILDIWGDLETQAPCSIYQTRAWLLPWIETLGKKAGITPFFVVARGVDHRPLALLALGLVRRGPLRIATWLGGRDSNINMPLLRPDVVWTSGDLQHVLRQAAKACRPMRVDLFHLANQPLDWQGRANPFALLPHQQAPSDAYGTTLPTDPEAFFAAKLSKDTRKKLRKKEAKLAASGPIQHLVVTDDAAQQRVIDSFIALKVARFQARKIVSDFDSPEMRAFIEAASRPHGSGIELHALLAGDRIVAIYGGAAHAGQWSGMFNAFDADEEIAKSSPGDLLLMRIMAKACTNGCRHFDLGIGQARYKAALCDTPIVLFDAIVPVSAVGRIAAALVAIRQMAKRAIKANPRLFALSKRIAALRA